MKLIAMLSIFIATGAFASIPHNVCAEQFKIGSDNYNKCISGDFNQPLFANNKCDKLLELGKVRAYEDCISSTQFKPNKDRCDELYDRGDMRGYEDCVSSFPHELSIPRNMCAEYFGFGTDAYDKCMNGQFDTPLSAPKSWCDEVFGAGTEAAEKCREPQFSIPFSLKTNMCAEYFGEGTEAYDRCMKPQFSIPFSTPKPVCETLPEPQRTYCKEGQFGEPVAFSIPASMCKKFLPHNVNAYVSCMNGEFDKKHNETEEMPVEGDDDDDTTPPYYYDNSGDNSGTNGSYDYGSGSTGTWYSGLAF